MLYVRAHHTDRRFALFRSFIFTSNFSPTITALCSKTKASSQNPKNFIFSPSLSSMEFWGVEVKAGESVKVEATQEVVIHISQAALGEAKNDKKNELVPVFLTVDSKKLIIGSLSAGKISQIACDFVLDRDFELSHNWKKGSVYFCGYSSPVGCDSDCDSHSESESDFGSDIPIIRTENGKSEPKDAKITIAKPTMSDSDDSKISDSDDSDSSDSEGGAVNVSGISLSGDESEDDSSDDDSSDEDISEETPKKVEPTKKRKAEEASKTPVPEKKAKLVTPQKSGEKKKGGVHVATPYPSKKSKQSGGQAASKSKN